MKYHRVKNGYDWTFIFVGPDSAYSMTVLRQNEMLYVRYISDLINHENFEVSEYFKTLKDAKGHFVGMVERGELK